jgi:hypothetical protein
MARPRSVGVMWLRPPERHLMGSPKLLRCGRDLSATARRSCHLGTQRSHTLSFAQSRNGNRLGRLNRSSISLSMRRGPVRRPRSPHRNCLLLSKRASGNAVAAGMYQRPRRSPIPTFPKRTKSAAEIRYETRVHTLTVRIAARTETMFRRSAQWLQACRILPRAAARRPSLSATPTCCITEASR